MGEFQKGISIDYSCCDQKVIDVIDDSLNKKDIVSAETHEIIGNHNGVFGNEQMDNIQALNTFISALKEAIYDLENAD